MTETEAAAKKAELEALLNRRQNTHTTVRPKLTAETVAEYLDWVVSNLNSIPGQQLATHLTACELVIRTRATDAQAKATQHTLVEDGIIDQPNQ
ncbi:MAG TPA: hypothetical protein VGU46_09305 [Acidobacteriaceae bacterium]|nr:hypothetical protein [Acidobacteriaceae bacterium]